MGPTMMVGSHGNGAGPTCALSDHPFAQQQFRGRSQLSQHIDNVPHEAAPLLRKWRDEGIPVLTSEEPWTLQTMGSLDDVHNCDCFFSDTDNKIPNSLASDLELREHFWCFLKVLTINGIFIFGNN